MAKQTQGIVLLLLWCVDENDPFLARGELRYLLDRDKQESPEGATPHGEHIRTIVARAELCPYNDADAAGRRIDAEALAAAEPVVEIKDRSPDSPDLALHLALLSPS